MEIRGMPVIVTGGASGLGRATALMLGGAGGQVAVFDLDEDKGPRTAQEARGAFFRVDVTDEGSVADGIAAAAEFGTARVLVNCAGIAPAVKTVGKDGTPHPLEIFRRVIGVNLVGTFTMVSRFGAARRAGEPRRRLHRRHGIARLAAAKTHNPTLTPAVASSQTGPSFIVKISDEALRKQGL